MKFLKWWVRREGVGGRGRARVQHGREGQEAVTVRTINSSRTKKGEVVVFEKFQDNGRTNPDNNNNKTFRLPS